MSEDTNLHFDLHVESARRASQEEADRISSSAPRPLGMHDIVIRVQVVIPQADIDRALALGQALDLSSYPIEVRAADAWSGMTDDGSDRLATRAAQFANWTRTGSVADEEELKRFEEYSADVTREGFHKDVYDDSRQFPTVGIGHKVVTEDHLKLGDKIGMDRIDDFFRKDGEVALDAACRQMTEAGITDPDFLNALASVNLQLGSSWNKQFVETWGDIRRRNYEKAALEAGRSDWARQTPARVAQFQEALRALARKEEAR